MVKQEGNCLAPSTSFYDYTSYDGLFSFGNDLHGCFLSKKMQADNDHDGRLTLGEMIENPYAFYGSVYLSDEDYFHDEFR
jgi:hypothetical protein